MDVILGNAYERLVVKNGEKMQIDKLREECEELTKAVINYQNANTDNEKYQTLLELGSEAGDVLLVLKGLKLIIPGLKNIIKADIVYKARREVDRMKKKARDEELSEHEKTVTR